MARIDGPEQVKIGILLTRYPENLGEWLADAAAFDAAGADALWIDLAPDLELDPLALTAALAAVTGRALLVSAPPRSGGPAADRTLATIGTLSRGRLRIVARPDEVSAGIPVLDQPERWLRAPLPDSRATWRATLLDAAERGLPGVLVPADPRLIDLLRNPEPGERLDLHLAAG